MQTNQDDITKVLVEYYQDMLGRKEKNRTKTFNSFLKNGYVLTTGDQLQLLSSYIKKEVKNAMFSSDANKSPGPDGYGSSFYRKAWSIVEKNITEAVFEFFANGKILQQLNSTMITLIPKIASPLNANEFRPISCCNVIYKCISKMICAMLKQVLSLIVNENQVTFVQGRSLIHNVLICHDLLRHYNRKISPRCLMEIDLRKAYDMVS